MELPELKEKLRTYRKEDIIITEHARIQAEVRNVDIEEVKQNIVNPDKLVFAKQQPAEKSYEEKYDCYFKYSKKLFHRYIIVINRKIIIVTIIKVNRDWQKVIEGK